MDYETLTTCFWYDFLSGKFYHRERPRNLFKTDKAFKIWNTRFAGKIACSKTQHGYYAISFNYKAYYSHRMVFLYTSGQDSALVVDHVDGNRGSNILTNLRMCNSSENQKNKRLLSNNKTGIHGVYWDNINTCWSVQIKESGKMKRIGRFKSFLDACAARKSEEIKRNFHKNHGGNNV